MPISIIIRSLRSSDLKNLINHLISKKESEFEIIAISRINDFNFDNNVNLIVENSGRFRAKITGAERARYDNLLFLDCDQIPQPGLLKELESKAGDMVIVPERSLNNSFTARCLDDWRSRNEIVAKKHPNPYIPVIPRYFKRDYVIRAIESLDSSLYGVVNHEDSILYYMVYKETTKISFSNGYIYNNDPPFLELMKKAYSYGKNQKEIKSVEIPYDIVDLINRLDMHTLHFGELGIGKGYLIQIPRGLMYKMGSLIS